MIIHWSGLKFFCINLDDYQTVIRMIYRIEYKRQLRMRLRFANRANGYR